MIAKPLRTISDTTLAFGEDVVVALLGLDQLYRSESGDAVGLAVVNLDTAGQFSPLDFPDYPSARSCFESLRREARQLPEVDRRAYYDDLCESSLAFIEWREGQLGFGDQLRRFLHVPVGEADPAELDALKVEMSAVLTDLGFKGSLREQCSVYETRYRVPADEVEGVLGALMEKAWDETNAKVVEIPADRSDGMRVRGVRDVSFNARCDYLSRTVDVNVDPILTEPALRHLAVHEGYPGHYVQFKLRQVGFEEGRAPADGLLSVVNTASSSVFEGIADTGMTMLGWTDPLPDRFQSLMNRYRAGIGAGAAWRHHALGWSLERTTDWLAEHSLVGGEGWVANRIGFIAAPSRAVLIWSYWWGERTVLPQWVGAAETSEQSAFVEYLYGRMHSNRTVGMFRQG